MTRGTGWSKLKQENPHETKSPWTSWSVSRAAPVPRGRARARIHSATADRPVSRDRIVRPFPGIALSSLRTKDFPSGPGRTPHAHSTNCRNLLKLVEPWGALTLQNHLQSDAGCLATNDLLLLWRDIDRKGADSNARW